MKTIEEIEKGCGCKFNTTEDQDCPFVDKNDMLTCGDPRLCPECKAIIQAKKEDLEIKRMQVERLRDKIDEIICHDCVISNGQGFIKDCWVDVFKKHIDEIFGDLK